MKYSNQDKLKGNSGIFNTFYVAGYRYITAVLQRESQEVPRTVKTERKTASSVVLVLLVEASQELLSAGTGI